jgi:multiple sugar transport system permease protein
MPQVILAMFGQGINSAILVLIFFNFFKMIPISLDEAARIDGASSLQVFYHIYIKLVIPIIFTVFLFSFVWNWNDVYSATIYYRANNPLVIMRLSRFNDEFGRLAQGSGQAGEIRINEAYRMAATLISILPLLILYIFAQKKFIEGIERTGMTGE